MKIAGDQLVTIGAGLALGLAIWYAWRQFGSAISEAAGSVGQAIGNAASTAAGAVDTGIAAPVLLIGDAIGVPRTNASRCEQAKRAGDTWTAAQYCPAGDWLTWIVDGEPAQSSTWSSGGATGKW